MTSFALTTRCSVVHRSHCMSRTTVVIVLSRFARRRMRLHLQGSTASDGDDIGSSDRGRSETGNRSPVMLARLNCMFFSVRVTVAHTRKEPVFWWSRHTIS